MGFLYGVGIRFYGLILRIAALFVPKAKAWVVGRQNFWEQLPKTNNQEVYWFHCASLGEFDQGLPLMNKLKTENPDIFLWVTFFSPSGFEHYQKRRHNADFVCYLPLDTQSNAKKLMAHFRPKLVFFVKYEFWKNYITAAKEQGAAIYSVSTLFREKHRFFKWYGPLFQGVLKQFDCFFVQNQASLELLKSIQINNAIVTGDTRFDRVIENKKNVTPDSALEGFLAGRKAFIIGSSWPEDEQVLVTFIRKYTLEAPVIIAPHDISESHLQQIEARFDNQIMRLSQIETTEINVNILLIDCIGKLANAYSYGSFAYVGGGFSGSLHNILEPAVFGLPVIFGPKHKRFPEAQHFIDAGVGFSIENEKQLETAVDFICTHAEDLSDKISDLVASSAGATDKIIIYLKGA